MNRMAPSGHTLADPWSQAAGLVLRLAQAAVALLVLAWAVGNVRPVPPDRRAVVLRFGEVQRVANPGLLLAWPEPIERIVLVPAAERQIDHVIARFRPMDGSDRTVLKVRTDSDVRENRGFLLTGDLGVVHLEATITYRIDQPTEYVVVADHVDPALERLFAASAAALCAGRTIEALMAIGPAADGSGATASGTRVPQPTGQDLAGQGAMTADDRARLRTDLVKAVNARLRDLEAAGVGLGVEVTRVDLAVSLPADAKAAFDAVLSAQQSADQAVANARASATRTAQGAEQAAARQLLDAQARASEQVAKAAAKTADISALAGHDPHDPGGVQIALRLYRERMAHLLRKIGDVVAVDPQGGTRVILPGPRR